MNERLQMASTVLVKQAQRFWHWWPQELIGLVPERWRERLWKRGNLLFVRLHDDQCILRFGNYSQQQEVVSADLGPQGELPPRLAEALLSHSVEAAQVILQLPEHKVLRRLLSLPAATEAGLGNVLRFEMDRHTPFTSEQVYFGYCIREHDRRQQRLKVELLVVLREYLDELLKRLESLGVHPSVVTLAEEGDAWSGKAINLLPGSHLRARRTWRGNRRLQVAVAVGFALLLALPLWQQQRRAERLAEELNAPKAAAERAAQVREELQQLEAGGEFLREQQAKADDVLEILNELTVLLPDSTWLSRFELIGPRVRLEGESAEASSLISMLEQSRTLQNVNYASPITNNPRTQKDRFSLIAERRSAQEAP
jgi:general secretion pathway protein L